MPGLMEPIAPAAEDGERFVGLTDDPGRAMVECGWPDDWTLFPFNFESHALAWAERLGRGGFQVRPARGWRYGYTFTGATRPRG
jgi:hypothetical protein